MRARKASGSDGLEIRAGDLIEMLQRRNPDASPSMIERAGSAMADFGARFVLGDRPPRASEANASVETHHGTGLGERIDPAEGLRRLVAATVPSELEEWAGPVAGARTLKERFGIARSTLQDWRRSGAVIGLLKGTRKHVFPLAQFVDGRPVQGLAETLAIIGDGRTAWLWLVEPHHRHGSLLERLKRGEIDVVLDAARADFR